MKNDRNDRRNDRDILFDIEKLGYKYKFIGKHVLLDNEHHKISVGMNAFTDRLEVGVAAEYKNTRGLEKGDIKKKRVEYRGTTYTALSPELLFHIYELLNYYIKEGVYENNN